MADQSSDIPFPSSSADHSSQDLTDSKTELLARVQSLRKDLREWRERLDDQVQTYRQELGELRKNLNVEVEELKTGFQDLRSTLRKQLDATARLSELIPKVSSPMKSCNLEEEDEVTKKKTREGMDESHSDSESAEG